MARREIQDAIRPLTVQPTRRQPRQRWPAAVMIAFLVIGTGAGYLLGLPNSTAEVVADTDAAAPVANQTVPVSPSHYDWLEQRPAEERQDAWAVYSAVETDGYLYLLVSDNLESSSHRSLWRSSDGEIWDQVRLELGASVMVTDLDVSDRALILSGWDGDNAFVWRSQPLPNGENPVWTAIALPRTTPWIGNLIRDFSTVTAVVNSVGEIVVVADMHIDLTNTLLELSGDSSVTSLLDYQGLPEIAVADSRLWMKIVAANGTDSVHTETIPPTSKIAPVAGHYGTEVSQLQAGAMWTSGDRERFEAVDLSEVPLMPTPQAFGDVFVSTIVDASETYQLWSSATGALWTPSPWTPPPECGDWQGMAIGGPGLLVTSDDFDTVCLTGNGIDWDTRATPSTKVSSTAAVWIEGGTNGYLAAAGNSLELAVLTSEDGFHWNRVESSPNTLGIRTFMVGERLITITRPVESVRPQSLIVWVGTPTEQ